MPYVLFFIVKRNFLVDSFDTFMLYVHRYLCSAIPTVCSPVPDVPQFV